MLIKVKELCWVDYISEEDSVIETREKLTAIRAVVYESTKDTLLEAHEDYINNFNSDNIIWSNDEFDGGCLDTIKFISVEEVDSNY